MKSLRRIALTVVLALGIGMSTGSAQAATTLDQSFVSQSALYSSPVMAQKVTAGITGALTSVQVGLDKNGTSTEGVTISIRVAAAGKQTRSDRASVLIPKCSRPTVVHCRNRVCVCRQPNKYKN